MKKIFVKTGNLCWVILCVLLAATGCQKNIEQPVINSTDATSQSNAANERKMKGNFQQVNIVSDISVFNPVNLDPYLVNAWGLTFTPPGFNFANTAWVIANGTGLSLGYNVATGTYVRPPEPAGDFAFISRPTGVVLLIGGNITPGINDFILPNGLQATSVSVLEQGVVVAPQDVGLVIIDNSSTAAYTGVTTADDGAPFLYVANFKAKTIDVFDGKWQKVNNKPFKDPSIPSDYAPFNIQNINNNLFVMYAKTVLGSTNVQVQAGSGLGYVDIFRPDGTLLKSFSKGGVLNSPWGCAMAPASWTNMQWDGNASGNNSAKNNVKNVQSVILIANSGDGHINAFNQDGQFLGSLHSGKKEAITIDGLKALSFAPATSTTINPNWLFFTAGPNNGSHGLFGYLQSQ